MNKHVLNFVIEGLMFLCMSAIAGIGFLIKYAMPQGKIARVKYGSGMELSFRGLDRHDWGAIHLYVGFALLILLVLHIILHWSLIKTLFKKTFGPTATRWVVGTVFLLLSASLLALPFLLLPVAIGGGGEHTGLRRGKKVETIPLQKKRGVHSRETVHGRMQFNGGFETGIYGNSKRLSGRRSHR